MRATLWWAAALLSLWAGGGVAALDDYSLCDMELCKCDSFRRITCNCTQDHQEVTIVADGRYKMLPEATQLSVYNCSRVYVKPNAIRLLRELRTVRFVQIASLRLGEDSLYWYPDGKFVSETPRGVRISIENSTMDEIPSNCIKGGIGELALTGVRLAYLRPFAVSTIVGGTTVTVTDSRIDFVGTQAFRKFEVDTFIVKNNTFGEVPSRTLSDVHVNRLLVFEGNTLDRTRSSFLKVEGPRDVYIVGNTVETVEADSFSVITEGPVNVQDNVFGEIEPRAFSGFELAKHVRERSGRQEFRFFNNTVGKMRVNSLLTDQDSYRIVIRRLRMDEECSCETERIMSYAPLDGEVYCRHEDGLFVTLEAYKRLRCEHTTMAVTLVVVIVLFSLVILIAIVIAAVLLFRKYIKGEQSIFYLKKKPDLPVVKPDGRTYKETELYVIVEKAELLTTDL